MALFPRSPMDAVRAGLEPMETVRVFNGHRANVGCRPIAIGVGVNTGSLMLGTIGESNRMEGTVISDTVNLASRLDGLTRTFGTEIIVSDKLLAACPKAAEVPHRCRGRVKLKGKSRAVTVYHIIDAPDPARVKTRPAFEAALAGFQQGTHNEAPTASNPRFGPTPRMPWLASSWAASRPRDQALRGSAGLPGGLEHFNNHRVPATVHWCRFLPLKRSSPAGRRGRIPARVPLSPRCGS